MDLFSNNKVQSSELVFNNSKGNDVTTSLIVAQAFGKEHKNVLRDIESLSCSDSFNRLNFERITYKDTRNREQVAYQMTKDGFSFLVMGYTGEKAGQFKEMFINEFNKREMMLKSDDYILARSQEILHNRLQLAEKQLAQANERISLQDTQLKQQAPKVKSYDEYISSDGTFTTTQIAKEYGWGAKTLNNKLKERGIQYKQNRQWLLTAKYDGKGYTKSIPCTFTYSDGTIGTQMQTVWTTKGREFIHSIFNAA